MKWGPADRLNATIGRHVRYITVERYIMIHEQIIRGYIIPIERMTIIAASIGRLIVLIVVIGARGTTTRVVLIGGWGARVAAVTTAALSSFLAAAIAIIAISSFAASVGASCFGGSGPNFR